MKMIEIVENNNTLVNVMEENAVCIGCYKTQCVQCNDTVKVNDSLEECIIRHCRECLEGAWSCENNPIHIFSQLGGTSNYLYVCSLASNVLLMGNEPRSVLVRIYGEMLGSSTDSIVRDSIIFAILSEKRLGPKLFGVFPGGRIEEFVKPSRVLTRIELQQTRFLKRNAMILASCHKLDMPLSKAPRFLFALMERWLAKLADVDRSCEPQLAQILKEYDLEREMQKIRNMFNSNKCNNFPVVFCHNDYQENNILLVEDSMAKDGYVLMPIDYEYCSYNYRCFDIGNHFNEFMFDYSLDKWPFFSIYKEDYPSREKQLLFCRTYLQHFGQDLGEDKPEEDLLIEITYGSAFSHLFWSVWAFVQSLVSNIDFAFLEYGAVRMQLYNELKCSLFNDDLCNNDSVSPLIENGIDNEKSCRNNSRESFK